MSLDRRAFVGAIAGLGISGGEAVARNPLKTAVQSASEPDTVFPIWPSEPPGGVPNGVEDTVIERDDPLGLRNRAAISVRTPTLSHFKARGAGRGAALIVPGGGYARVVIDKEGFELARLLAAKGVESFVLRYRLPGAAWAAGPDAPLQDVQRALRLVRRATGAKTLAIGFSAGGHLVGQLANRFAEPSYDPIDDADAFSVKPDGAALAYPVISMRPPFVHEGSRAELLGGAGDEAGITAYSLENTVRTDGPPQFVFSAIDDEAVPVDNALTYLAAARRAGVEIEAHFFEEGGHGFALRYTEGLPAAAWPELLLAWAVRKGVMKG